MEVLFGAASYVMAHWELIVVCVLAVAALGYAAFVLKNWKVALAAIIIACCGLAYQGADMAGYNRKVAEDVAAQTQIYKQRVDALNTLALKDAARAKSDAEKIEALQKVADATPKNDNTCFDVGTTRRVRAIGGAKHKPVAARTH